MRKTTIDEKLIANIFARNLENNQDVWEKQAQRIALEFERSYQKNISYIESNFSPLVEKQ